MRKLVQVVVLLAMGALGGCAAANAESHTYEQPHGGSDEMSCPPNCGDDAPVENHSTIDFVDDGP
jgi:hypothetical protein